MHGYEIRVINSKTLAASLVETAEASDEAAIRSARRIANGRAVEVWRDIECIYRAGVSDPRDRAA